MHFCTWLIRMYFQACSPIIPYPSPCISFRASLGSSGKNPSFAGSRKRGIGPAARISTDYYSRVPLKETVFSSFHPPFLSPLLSSSPIPLRLHIISLLLRYITPPWPPRRSSSPTLSRLLRSMQPTMPLLPLLTQSTRSALTAWLPSFPNLTVTVRIS